MPFESEITLLVAFTLLAVLVFAVWQYRKAQKAKRHKEHSAVTEGRPDLRATDGAPGVRPR